MLLFGPASLIRPKTFTFIFDIESLDNELKQGKEAVLGHYTIRKTSHDYKVTHYGNIIVKRSMNLERVIFYVMKEVGWSGTFTVRKGKDRAK